MSLLATTSSSEPERDLLTQAYIDKFQTDLTAADVVRGKVTVTVEVPEGYYLEISLAEKTLREAFLYSPPDASPPPTDTPLILEISKSPEELPGIEMPLLLVFGYERVEDPAAKAPTYTSDQASLTELSTHFSTNLDPAQHALVAGTVTSVESSSGRYELLVQEDDGNLLLLSCAVTTQAVELLNKRQLFLIHAGARDLLESIEVIEVYSPPVEFLTPKTAACVEALRDGLEKVLDTWPSIEEEGGRLSTSEYLGALKLEPREYLHQWLKGLHEWCNKPHTSTDAVTNLHAATGLGKSQFFSLIAKVLPHDRQVVVLSNSLANLSQIAGKLRYIEGNITHSCSRHIPYAAKGHTGRIHLMSHAASDLDRKEVEGGVVALRSKLTPSFVFIDEMDLMGIERYMELVRLWQNEGAVVICASATKDHVSTSAPWSGTAIATYTEGGRTFHVLRLGDHFFGETFAATPMGEAIAKGYLPKPSLRRISAPFTGAFLNDASLGSEWDRFERFLLERINEEAVQSEVRYERCSDEGRIRPLGIRVSTKDRAAHLTSFLSENGIPTGCITGDTPPIEREYLLEELEKQDGAIHALVGVNVIGRGLDTSMEWIIDCVCSRQYHPVQQFIGRAGRAREESFTDLPPTFWQIVPSDSNRGYISHAEALEYAGLPSELAASLELPASPLEHFAQATQKPSIGESVKVQFREDTLHSAYAAVQAELGEEALSWRDFLVLLQSQGYGSFDLSDAAANSHSAGIESFTETMRMPGLDVLDLISPERTGIRTSLDYKFEVEAPKALRERTDALDSEKPRVLPLVHAALELAAFENSLYWKRPYEIKRLLTNDREAFSTQALTPVDVLDDGHLGFAAQRYEALNWESLLEQAVQDLVAEHEFANPENFRWDPPILSGRAFEEAVFYSRPVWERVAEELGLPLTLHEESGGLLAP